MIFNQPFTKKTKLKIALVIFVTFFISLAISIWVFIDIPLTSPINSLTTFMFLNRSPKSNNHKIIYGFLPYWNINKVTIQPELTHLSYFSLILNNDGNFASQTKDNELEMGLHKLNSNSFLQLTNKLQEQNKQLELVISQFNHDDIVTFLNSQSAQENFFVSLDNVLIAYPFTGINLDFETSKDTTPQTRKNLTNFITNLRKHLDQKYSHIQLSIDMYASGATTQQIWNIKDIAQQVDYIVIMAYDFHHRSSSLAGPVAPLFGGKKFWEGDINHYLQAYLKIVPAHKILLGVPFYGYEWQTTSRKAQSQTFPNTGSTASYQRVMEILTKKEELLVQEHWNEDALSPYISYIEDGQTFVVYYENSRSISYKLDYVNQLNLGGIAIWALGYESNSRELWDVVQRKLNTTQ